MNHERTTTTMDDYEDDWIEPPGAAFCDRYEAHPMHTYWALNHNHYLCPGMTAEDLAEMERVWAETCPHGLALWLCAGPDHYPTD